MPSASQYVRRRREVLALTQADLARAANITRANIAALESRAHHTPRPGLCGRLAKALDVEPTALLAIAGHLDGDWVDRLVITPLVSGAEKIFRTDPWQSTAGGEYLRLHREAAHRTAADCAAAVAALLETTEGSSRDWALVESGFVPATWLDSPGTNNALTNAPGVVLWGLAEAATANLTGLSYLLGRLRPKVAAAAGVDLTPYEVALKASWSTEPPWVDVRSYIAGLHEDLGSGPFLHHERDGWHLEAVLPDNVSRELLGELLTLLQRATAGTKAETLSRAHMTYPSVTIEVPQYRHDGANVSGDSRAAKEETGEGAGAR